MKTQIHELAVLGRSARQISEALGADVRLVYRVAREDGIKLTRSAHRRSDGAGQKIERILDAYGSGKEMAQVANESGVSRQYVHLVLKRAGCIRPRILGNRKEAVLKERDAKSIQKYGLSVSDLKPFRERGLLQAFVNQRNAAHARGIEFRFKFAEWLAIWQESGRLGCRGRGKDGYVMSRYGDHGAYEHGNVFIQRGTNNSRDGLHKAERPPKPFKGVFLVYPGLSRPWQAKFGKMTLGYFETPEAANDAREKYFSANA